MISSLFHAQGAGGAPQQNFLISMAPFFLIIVVFYFLLIAPMRKKQKKLQEMLNQLKAGDRVITTGGMYGTIVVMADDVVQLKIASNVKIDIAKSGIAGLATGPAQSDS